MKLTFVVLNNIIEYSKHYFLCAHMLAFASVSWIKTLVFFFCYLVLLETLVANCIFLMLTSYKHKCIVYSCEEVTDVVLLIYLCGLMNYLSYVPEYICVHYPKWYTFIVTFNIFKLVLYSPFVICKLFSWLCVMCCNFL